MNPSPKSTRKPAHKRGGRPLKGDKPAEHLMTTRWTDTDKGLLDALVADERAKLEAAGIMQETAARVAAVDVLRSLVRQEAQRRGLLEAPVAKAS